MANYLVIENGVVVNLIVAENKEEAESVTEKLCIEEEPGVNIGWLYDGNSFTPEISD